MSHQNPRSWLKTTTLVLAVGILLIGTPLAASWASDGPEERRPPAIGPWDTFSVSEVYAPEDGFYTYAPSVVRDGNTDWIWTCHNDTFRVVKDHIYLTRVVDDVVIESRSVLEASPAPAWDSFHVCDPSVVAGKFAYQGDKYKLAMFYLGNDLDASAHNQIGVAFANDPAGPWVKLPKPVVTSDRIDQWGVGQPTAVVMPGNPGKVLLGYTQGDTSTRAYSIEVDLRNAERFTATAPRADVDRGADRNRRRSGLLERIRSRV